MDERKWTKLKISLKKSIGENNFNNWLSPVEFSHVNEDVAVFSVPTNFLGNYVSQNFGEIIVAQISSENDKINRIRFEVDSDLSNFEGSQPSTPSPSNVPKDNELVSAQLDKRFTFDAFVVGKPNELAHAAARRVAEGAEVSFNPLFLYGGVGLGKNTSHACYSLGAEQPAARYKCSLFIRRTIHVQICSSFERAQNDGFQTTVSICGYFNG